MVSTGPASTDSRPLKLCPNCGRTSDAAENRCTHCLADVTQARILGTEDAERHAEADRVDDARREKRRRRLTQRELWTRRILLGAVVALIGWWVYRNFIYEPPPIPAASDPSIAQPAAGEAWAGVHGDAAGTRRTSAPSHIDGAEAWRFDLRAGGTPSTSVKTAMVSDGERLYVTTTDNRIVALDATTGALAWERRLQNAPYSAPTVAGGRLYVALLQGALEALDATTGESLWLTNATKGTFQSSPVVADGVAYVFGTQGAFGFDAVTGERIWALEHRSTWATVTAIVEGPYLVGAGGRDAKVYHRERGVQTYFLEFARSEPNAILADRGEVFAMYRGSSSAFRIDEQRPWWEVWRAAWTQAWIIGWAPSPTPPPTLWAAGATPYEVAGAAMGEDRVFVAGREGELVAIARDSGAEAWETRTLVATTGPVVASDGLLLTHREALTLVDPADGREIRRRMFETPVLQSTVTAAGTYLALLDGTVVMLR